MPHGREQSDTSMAGKPRRYKWFHVAEAVLEVTENARLARNDEADIERSVYAYKRRHLES